MMRSRDGLQLQTLKADYHETVIHLDGEVT